MEEPRPTPGPIPGPTGPTPAPVEEPSPAPANPIPRRQVGAKMIMEVSHPNKNMFGELAKFMTDNGFTFRRID